MVETIFEDDVSDEEMDRSLADRHDEIAAKLNEARTEIARGESAPLEPSDVFLHRAQKRFEASR